MNSIQQEAEKRYPEYVLVNSIGMRHDISNHMWNAFIAGATYEQERSKGLYEALKGLVADVRRKPNDTRYATHLKIAEQALLNYNQ